jgi:hypothetical protein
MSRITQKGQGAPLSFNNGGSFQVSADSNLATLVGSRYDLSDGREVMLVSVGATAIGTSGLLLQDRAIVANHQSATVGTYTAYSANGNVPASVVLEIGATAMVKDEYQGGFMLISGGAGIGQTLRIASNSVALASSTVATVTLEDAPNVALTATSKVCLIPPHGANVVSFPTTPTGAAVGISLYPLTAGIAAGATTGTPSFGFVTTKGITSSISDAQVTTVGLSVAPSISVVGATTLSASTGAIVVGYANQTSVSGQGRSIFVNL